MQSEFRSSLAGGRVLVGAFIKTSSPETAELLGHAGMDYAILDAEHAPLDLGRIDRIVLGARSSGLPCLVRIPSLVPGLIGQVLDLGAAGIVVPQIRTADDARTAVAEAHYAGRRGYSPSTRAANYGFCDTKLYAEQADAAATVWCQIENSHAMDNLEAIAAVESVDLLLIGRADLALSLGCAAGDPRLNAAVDAIIAAAKRHRRKIAIYVASMDEAPAFAAKGVSVFVCGSDLSHLAAASQAMLRARDALASGG